MEAPLDDAQKQIIVLDAGKREIIRGLSILLLIIVVFIFLRLVFKMVGASESLVVGFVYFVSGLFVFPFFGIFPQNDSLGTSTFDGAALMALFCYLILIPMTMVIAHIGTTMLKTGKKVNEAVKHDNPVTENKELINKVVK